jgi:5-methylcytosine-specific restriction protein A
VKRPWKKRPDSPKRLSGRRLQRERERLFRNEPLCRRCAERGIIRAATERDHIKPIAEGGSEHPENIQALCHDCNMERLAEQRGYTKRRKVGADGWPE